MTVFVYQLVVIYFDKWNIFYEYMDVRENTVRPRLQLGAAYTSLIYLYNIIILLYDVVLYGFDLAPR